MRNGSLTDRYRLHFGESESVPLTGRKEGRKVVNHPADRHRSRFPTISSPVSVMSGKAGKGHT